MSPVIRFRTRRPCVPMVTRCVIYGIEWTVVSERQVAPRRFLCVAKKSADVCRERGAWT